MSLLTRDLHLLTYIKEGKTVALCTFAFTVPMCFAWYQIGLNTFVSCKYIKGYNFKTKFLHGGTIKFLLNVLPILQCQNIYTIICIRLMISVYII